MTRVLEDYRMRRQHGDGDDVGALRVEDGIATQAARTLLFAYGSKVHG